MILTPFQNFNIDNIKSASHYVDVYNSTIEKGKELQMAYTKGIYASNAAMGSYLASLNGAKASLIGYIKYLISAQGATLGLTIKTKALELGVKGLKIAGNMLLVLGITELISLIVKGIDNLVHAQQHAIDKANLKS